MTASLDNLVYLQAGDWEAYVLPAFGSNLISLSCQGQAILRTPRDLSALARGHGPPLGSVVNYVHAHLRVCLSAVRP